MRDKEPVTLLTIVLAIRGAQSIPECDTMVEVLKPTVRMFKGILSIWREKVEVKEMEVI